MPNRQKKRLIQHRRFFLQKTLVWKLWYQGNTGSISYTHSLGVWGWRPSTYTLACHMCCVQDLRSPAGPLRNSTSRKLGQRGSGTGAEGRGRGSEGQACLERLSWGRQRSSACSDSLVQMAAVWFSRNGKQLWPALSPPTLDWDPTGEGGHLHERDNLANQIWPCQNPKSHFPFQPADWNSPSRIRLNHFQLCFYSNRIQQDVFSLPHFTWLCPVNVCKWMAITDNSL